MVVANWRIRARYLLLLCYKIHCRMFFFIFFAVYESFVCAFVLRFVQSFSTCIYFSLVRSCVLCFVRSFSNAQFGYAEHAVLSLVTSKLKDCFSCFVFVLLFSIFLHKPCLERKLTAGNNVRRDFSCILYVIRISYLAFKYSLWSCVSRNLHWICIELF